MLPIGSLHTYADTLNRKPGLRRAFEFLFFIPGSEAALQANAAGKDVIVRIDKNEIIERKVIS